MKSGDGRWSKSVWVHEPILTAERKVWRGVLEQAYLDAELPLDIEADDKLFIDQDRARVFSAQTRLTKKKT